VTIFALLRVTPSAAAAGSVWIAVAALGGAAALLGTVKIMVEYRLRKMDAELRGKQAQTAAELQKIRLEIHRAVVEKAAGEPASARSYRELIIADALHLAVEQNGAQLSGPAHTWLYGPPVPGCPPESRPAGDPAPTGRNRGGHRPRRHPPSSGPARPARSPRRAA
jgi:hypothetical protein